MLIFQNKYSTYFVYYECRNRRLPAEDSAAYEYEYEDYKEDLGMRTNHKEDSGMRTNHKEDLGLRTNHKEDSGMRTSNY